MKAQTKSGDRERDKLQKGCAQILRAVADGRAINDVLEIEEATLSSIEEQAFRFYKSRNLEKAKTLIRGLSALEPGRFYPQLLLGDIFLKEADYESASECIEKALEIEPHSVEARLKLCETKIRSRSFREARKLLAQLEKEMGPEDAQRQRVEELRSSIDSATGKG